MIEVKQARRKILSCVRRQRPRRFLLEKAAGLVLAGSAKADRDLPPFDRAAMDGYAVRAADVATSSAELYVVGAMPAGSAAGARLRPGQCAKISTGAALAPGADSVVMVEHSEALDGKRVRLAGPVRRGQHVARRGEEARRGRVLVRRGNSLTPARMGVLAMVGCTEPLVYPPPSAAVLATGNELVGVHQKPGAGQIRDSNSTLVEAMLRRFGLPQVQNLGIAGDRRGQLSRSLRQGLKADVLVVTGGVSVGEFDLVPDTLLELGCSIAVHKVAMKPGKPLLFARGPSGQAVFGLPGNPVAVLVSCFEFVGPVVRKLMGQDPAIPERRARLKAACTQKPGRMAFLPGHTVRRREGLEVEPVPWHGSGDLVAASRANSLIVLPKSVRRRAKGDMVTVHLLTADLEPAHD